MIARSARDTVKPGGQRLWPHVDWTYVVALAALAGVVCIGVLADLRSREAFKRHQSQEVLRELDLLRANIEGLIDGDVQLLRGLIAVIATRPDMDQTRFETIARRMVGDINHVESVAAARVAADTTGDAFERFEAYLGGTTASQLPAIEAALREGDPAMTALFGPYRLAGGADGLIVKGPVMVGEEPEARLWGTVALVIDANRLYRASGLASLDLPIELALTRDGPDEGTATMIFGSASVLDREPVSVIVTIPFGEWRLSAVPAGGWAATPPDAWLLWLAVLGFSALAIAPLPLAHRLEVERQRTFAALAERERELDRISRRLDLALTASTVGVWDYNIDRDELIWDHRMNELYGMPGEKREHSYEDWRERLHPDDLAAAEEMFRGAIAGRARYDTRFRLGLPDGSIRHIRALGAVYRDADGTSKIVGVNWDVTADVEREEEMRARRREAEAASVAKSRFLAAMSHEIRTPMSGVLGMLDLLLDSRLDAEQRSQAETARDAAAALLTILNDILDLSKLEADSFAIKTTDMRVDLVVDEVVALFHPMAAEKGLALVVDVAPHVPLWVVGDIDRLRQVVLNLVSNAIKFTDAGRIAVRVGWSAGTLSIAVEDTGIGIAPADCEHLFQPFTQVETDPGRRPGGTGLGLAICHRLVTLMNGSIRVESEPGRGSTFTVTLAAPRGLPRQPAPARRPIKAPPVLLSAAPPPLDILLVEDNRTNQMVVTALLKRAGHRVTIAGDGIAALETLQELRFDVVLMDVEMPRMDGPAATAAIRALPGPAARLPVIALTANAMAGDRDRYLALGMTDYLSKPIDSRALHAALARAVDPAGSAGAPAEGTPGAFPGVVADASAAAADDATRTAAGGTIPALRARRVP